MLQTVMYIGLGFLTATLIALLLAPPLWRHAVDKTTKLIRASTPLTMAEIQADRDQLRAEHALVTRKLEVEASQAKEKSTRQALDIATKMEQIGVLKATIEQQKKQLDNKDTELLGLSEQVAALEAELRAKARELEQQNDELAESKAGLHRQPGERIEPALEISASGTDIRQKGDVDVADMAREISDLVAEISAISSQKLNFESQRTNLRHTEQKLQRMKTAPVKNIETTQIKLSALEVERARLLADLTGVVQKKSQIKRKLEKSKAKWKGSANPYAEMIAKIDTLSEQMTTLSAQLAKDGEKQPEEIDAKDANKIKQGPKPDTKKRSARAGSNPTLADRIRALQNEIAQ